MEKKFASLSIELLLDTFYNFLSTYFFVQISKNKHYLSIFPPQKFCCLRNIKNSL